MSSRRTGLVSFVLGLEMKPWRTILLLLNRLNSSLFTPWMLLRKRRLLAGLENASHLIEQTEAHILVRFLLFFLFLFLLHLFGRGGSGGAGTRASGRGGTTTSTTSRNRRQFCRAIGNQLDMIRPVSFAWKMGT